ncbi:tetratricopeptide repeat-containing protein [Flammula alnicola]|nr:tetratricopeptide repeat-containing protein [Flammula alnicola]
MASKPTSTPIFDKFKAFVRRKTPQPPEASNIVVATSPPVTPIPPQSSGDDVAPAVPNAPDIPSPPVAPQKAFVKSKMFEKDIAILSVTYILEENPELKRLIHLIVSIHDKDEEDQLNGVLETCARFSVQLASATEAHRAEATEAITVFVKTVEKIKTVQLAGDAQSLDALTSMVDDEIAKIKSSHPPFARDRSFGTSEGLSKVLTATIGASITVLGVVKEASAVIPVPWVQTVIGKVVSLLNAVMQTRSNYSDMKQIAATAGEFVISCAVICSERTTEPSKELKRALNKFTRTLESIVVECDELSRLNPFWRYLQQNVQMSTLQGIGTRLNIAIELFQTESQVHMQLDIKDLSRKFDYAALNSLPNHPHYVRNEYLGGSRDDVLGYISGWIDKPNELVLWMHGTAGLGKSTVGQQLVHLLKDDDRLAGGVFLTNLTTEHPETVIQMIAKQLGEMHPRAIANISEAARKLNGPHSPLRDYLTAYIIDPVHELEYPYQLVIVIDGLEEWTNHESFLAELAHIPTSSALKFILTSRPSHSIERVLDKIPVQQYPLPPVSQEIVEHYFSHHFEKIDWRGQKPDQQTINRLATHAHGLLIWAATVGSLLSHESDERYPHVILHQILSSEEKVGTRSGEQLERLYRDAIATLFPEPDMREKLRNFLGAMMVLQEALPIRDFAGLLGMSDRPAEEIQRRLAALQTRGDFKSDVIPPALQQFHVSFLEFIESASTEYNGHSIAISSTNAHSMLANRCLEIIFFELLQSPRGKTCAYSELRGVEPYAVKFWPLHLSNGSSRPPLAPSTTRALIDISEENMHCWATLFLPSVAARFQDGYDSLDNIPKSALLYKLAMIIGKEDVTTLSYQLYCLEIAVRLQPINVGTWIALGEAYHRLYEHGGYNKNLDEAIGVFRHALDLVSRKSACEGSQADVGVDVARDGGGRTNTSGTDAQGSILTWVAHVLRTRFDQRGASSDLDEAISFHREALGLRPAPHSSRSTSLNDLAAALLTRFEQRGTSNNLDEAILLHRETLVLWPAPHPDRSMSLNNLANTLRTSFEQRGASDDLDEAISLHREALGLRPAPHPYRSTSLNNLATALHAYFEQRGTSNDLDEAISLYREALVLPPASHPDRSPSLDNLAATLRTRFEQRGASNDLDEAISLHRHALVLRPAPHPHRSASLDNLAAALQSRFSQRGASNDLDEAISLHREALILRPAPHPALSMSLSNLAAALQSRFGQRGASNDLEEAISLHREALILRPAPHPNRSQSLNNLANSLHTRFGKRGTSNDLDEAISLHREALILRQAPHPDRFQSLNNLANALQTHFEQQGASSDLAEAISLNREALVLLPAPHPHRSTSLNTLALALQICFDQRGASNDLDEAISLHREALVLRPGPHPYRSQSLNNLANSLQTRSGERGTSNDLDEAISLHREALVLFPAPHPDQFQSLNNLANALHTRFEQQGTSNDLAEAILLNREALVLLPAPHPRRSMSLDNLAIALRSRFKQWGTSNDLDEAISLHREALVLRPVPHPTRSGSLNYLATALRTRFEHRGTSNDLDEAICLYREALVLRPASHPKYSNLLKALAVALQSRFEKSHLPQDRDEVILLYRRHLRLRRRRS